MNAAGMQDLTPGSRTPAVLPPMRRGGNAARVSEPFRPIVVKEWMRSCPIVPPHMRCGELVHLFRLGKDVECAAVCDDEKRPIGLVMKHHFFRTLGSLYGMSIFGERPVTHLMESRPLIEETDVSPQRLIDRALSRDEDTFYDAVLLTRHGKMAGILTVRDLLHLSRLLQREASIRQIRTVRGAEAMIRDVHAAVEKVAETSRHTRGCSETIGEMTARGRRELQVMLGLFRKWAEMAVRQEEAVALLMERTSAAGRVIEMIAQFAGQCNILAINAAIEASRAGPHGRGFAVVANEVRELADQTKRSAKQIGGLLQSMLEAAEGAADLVREGKAGADAGFRQVRQSEETFNLLWGASADNLDAAANLLQAAEEAKRIADQIREQVGKLAEEMNGEETNFTLR